MNRQVLGGVLLVIALLLTAVSPAMAKDDWQYWSEYNFTYKLSDRWSLILAPSVRIKDDVTEDQYWESRQGISFAVNAHWAVNLHYLHSESKNNADKWIDENTFELQPTYKWQWAGMDFSDRLRLEYRIVNGVEKWRYRNLIKCSKKVNVGQQVYMPFISNEFFYDESTDEYNQNRARLGVGRKLSKAVNLSVFYQYKTNLLDDNWYGENVVGTGLEVAL